MLRRGADGEISLFAVEVGQSVGCALELWEGQRLAPKVVQLGFQFLRGDPSVALKLKLLDSHCLSRNDT